MTHLKIASCSRAGNGSLTPGDLIIPHVRPDLRAVPRYFLTPSLPAYANGRTSRVIDLSVRGARLELVEKFEPGESIFLMIIAEGIEITVPATVLWCEIDSLDLSMIHDRYLCGLGFEKASSAVATLIDELAGRDAAIRIEDFRHFDRFYVTAPLTGSFGDVAPISLNDLSVRGARITANAKFGVGAGDYLRFQVDEETGPIDVYGKIMWTAPTMVSGQMTAGLAISGHDEELRNVIHRLCVRGEARIDLDSLRRKFDALRAQAARRELATGAA